MGSLLVKPGGGVNLNHCFHPLNGSVIKIYNTLRIVPFILFFSVSTLSFFFFCFHCCSSSCCFVTGKLYICCLTTNHLSSEKYTGCVAKVTQISLHLFFLLPIHTVATRKLVIWPLLRYCAALVEGRGKMEKWKIGLPTFSLGYKTGSLRFFSLVYNHNQPPPELTVFFFFFLGPYWCRKRFFLLEILRILIIFELQIRVYVGYRKNLRSHFSVKHF